jgi:hypothetical protein
MERDFLVPFVGQPSRALQTSAERTSEAASQKSALRSVTNGPGKTSISVLAARLVSRPVGRCPLYPQKRTCATQEWMSALGQ